MQLSLFQTFAVPALGAGAVDPVAIARASKDAPARVLVRNTTAPVIFLGSASEDVAGDGQAPSSATYQLPDGGVDVFVLAPRQILYATANGGGAVVVVATSAAIPLGAPYVEQDS